MSTISGAVGGRTVTLSIADSTAAALAETIVSNTAVTIVTNSVQLKNYAAQIGIFTSGIAGAIGVPQFDYFAADNTSPAIVTGGGVPSYQAPDGKLYPLSPTETYGVLAGQGRFTSRGFPPFR